MAVETGHQTEFHLWDPSLVTPALVELDELIEVPLPSGAADLIDASHMKTTGYKSYIGAPLKEGEEADLVMNYIPGSATDVLLRAAKADGVARTYKIVLKKGAGTWEVTGSLVVRDYKRSNPMADRRTATATVKWVSSENEAAGV
jgi:Lambda phage tail tube protein, TTP